MLKSSLVPCQRLCLNEQFQKLHKVITLMAAIPEEEKPFYCWCKWCEVFLYSKKCGIQCWCCHKPIHRVFKKQHNGKYYEYQKMRLWKNQQCVFCGQLMKKPPVKDRGRTGWRLHEDCQQRLEELRARTPSNITNKNWVAFNMIRLDLLPPPRQQVRVFP